MEAHTIQVFDDIDGPALTPAVVQNKCFAWDGHLYVIDLGKANLDLITEFMLGLVANARAVDEMPRRPQGITLETAGQGATEVTKPTLTNAQKEARRARLLPIRDWAKANGWPQISNMGIIPKDAIAAYETAHGGGQQ